MFPPRLVVSALCVRDFYERHAISLVMESSVKEKGQDVICLLSASM